MAELPRGTVAFLFTDVAGSTRLWQHHRAAMERAYARHDAVLRGAVADQGGVVYKVIGDAVQAAFPTAEQAVAAALEVQLGLAFQDWAGLGLPESLKVRTALHAGAVDPDSDGDYRSPVLNRLGRLLGAGHGGQILLSQAVAQLARDRLPEETTLKDLGEHRLKDLLEPERVWQLVHPVLPTDFPTLTTLTTRPHNLPLQPTPLLGREREVEELTALLHRDDVRLVTLTGPGGTGKTRLALQAAAELVDEFPDGVWFVPLASLTDPALVPSAIAEVLGVRESGATPLPELLGDHLADKRLLLVLDNFEQVLDAAPVVADAIASPAVKVLVTSRAPLRLRGEREHPVPPLGLPKRKPPPTMEQVSQYAAVRLFIERAQAVRHDFAVTNENAPAIAEICHRLDGLPLAIELAAARVRLFPPQAMLARLEQRLPLLTGGARDLPLRQQTLTATIAWSYDLLTDDERKLYRRLSVFAGGWNLAAAEAVAGSPGSGELGLDVLAGLEALSEHSLVHQMPGDADEARFAMLETIREYGLGQLAASGEAAEAHQRHAAHVLELAEIAEPELYRADEAAWLDRLEAEHDNLRAAMGWSLANEPQRALRLVAGAWRFWYVRGYLREGQDWVERALAAADEGLSVPRVRALNGLAVFVSVQGDFARGWELEEASLAMARALRDALGEIRALHDLGIMATNLGRADRARTLYEEALGLAREHGELWWEASALHNLGDLATDQGDGDRAELLLEQSIAIARRIGNWGGVAVASFALGEVFLTRGDVRRAAREYGAGLRLLSRIGYKDHQMMTLNALAVAGAEGRPRQAARLLGGSEAAQEAVGLVLERRILAQTEQAVAHLRAALEPAVMAAAWAAGRALSLDEAVIEALALADELAGEGAVTDTPAS